MAEQKADDGLKRVVGVSGLAFSIVNCSIGSGIFVLPAVVGIALGGFAVFSYLACCIMLAAIMLCYAEIGSRVTTSGGSYAYVEAAFGDLPGFMVNILYFFGWGILGSAAVMHVIADSLAVMYPSFLNPVNRGLLFFGLIALMILVNVRGAKQGIGMLILVTIIKLLPLFALIVLGLGLINPANLQWETAPSLKTFGDTTLLLFFAFAGFEVALGMSGEFKNPHRTVPKGIILGGIIVLIIYMVLQMVIQGVLGDTIAASKDAPLAAVAERIAGPAGTTILLFSAVFSCFGNVHADIMGTPRSLFAAANDGMLPGYLRKVHPVFATPHWAIITYGSLVFIVTISGGFKQLAVLASAAILLIYLTVILATIKFRTKQTEKGEKPFIIPGGLTMHLLGIAAIVWLLTGLSKWEIISATIFLAAVSIIYFTMKGLKKKRGIIAGTSHLPPEE